MPRPEIYVSLDIETDGPAPGVYSMLSLGAASFIAPDGRDGDDEPDWREGPTWYATLEPLHGADRHADTMAWWKTQPDAWAEVNRAQADPEEATEDFALWLEMLPGQIGVPGGRLIAAAWPAGFDFAFTNYYLWRFAGRNPLGHTCLDIRSYATGTARHAAFGGLSSSWLRSISRFVDTTGLRDHVAVDDAVGQGRTLMAVLAAARKLQAGQSFQDERRFRHTHTGDGTVEGCPGCFPGPGEDRPRLRATEAPH